MDELLPKRKPTPRLRSFDYLGQFVYSITVCAYSKTPIFTNERIVSNVLEVLDSVCQKEQFSILAYCFMPDHLHILLAGGERSVLIRMMKCFKQRTSYWFKKTYGDVLWQRGYYDHVLRKDEDLQVVARYIWGNPVRNGLVSSIEDYQFSGPKDCGPT